MIESIRDWVVIFAGLLWMVGTLVVALIFGGLWFASSKGLSLANNAVVEKLRPFLDTTHARVAALRDRTSRLPGNTPLPDAVGKENNRRLPKLSLPFRRKRRRFPLLR